MASASAAGEGRSGRPPGFRETSGTLIGLLAAAALEGIATEGLADRADRTAYRDCMAGRLKSDR